MSLEKYTWESTQTDFLSTNLLLDKIQYLTKLILSLQNDVDRLLQRIPEKEDTGAKT